LLENASSAMTFFGDEIFRGEDLGVGKAVSGAVVDFKGAAAFFGDAFFLGETTGDEAAEGRGDLRGEKEFDLWSPSSTSNSTSSLHSTKISKYMAISKNENGASEPEERFDVNLLLFRDINLQRSAVGSGLNLEVQRYP